MFLRNVRSRKIYTVSHPETIFFNIKIDLRETGWDGMDWIDLA
jgi:hypothetical protein